MNASSPTYDLIEVAQFLTFWATLTGVDHITLVAILPDGPTTARTFQRSDDYEMGTWVAEAQRAGRNIYFQPNETFPNCASKPAKKQMMAGLSRFADVDPADGFPLAEERDRLGRLADHLNDDPTYQPTVIIDSGNGVQVIWATVREVLSPFIIARIEAETKAIETAIGAGGTHNIDRLLRLPGTINFPNTTKRAKGRGTGRARLIYNADTLYTAEQIADLAAHLTATLPADLVRLKTKPNGPTSSGKDADVAALAGELAKAGADAITEEEHLSDDLRQRLDAALEAKPRLADRWAGMIDDLTQAGRDSSRSALDMSLAAMLKGAKFTHRDAGLILCAYAHGKANGDPWTGNARLRHVARCVLRSQAPTSTPTPDPRPTIRCAAGKVDVLADAAEQALLQAGADIFQRADRLVRPGQAEVSAADGRTTIAAGLYEINDAALIEELTRVAIWEKYNARSKNSVQCDPPPLVANVLAARKGRWGLRSVAGVLTCPTLRPDGSILSKPGYDPATRLYYMPDHTLRMPSIPERPSKRDAEQGLETIKELLIDFKFVGAVDRAVALSLIISSIVRGALHMVPLHAFTAPTPGSGKSYLADITTAIVSGRYCPVITPGRSEEELEKRLGSMLLSGCPTISLDNISSELTGDALCQVTERPTIRIRILGKSETPECEFRGIVIANGNNLVVAGDMTRRVVIGKLDTGLERPEGREFNSDPVRMVLADRGKYIAAALTIVRAYIAADKPDKLIPLASYAAWSDLVRSSLIWLGNADPVISMQEARDNDPVVSTLRAALEAWRPAFGDVAKTTSEVAAKLFGFDPDTPEGRTLLNLREALVPVASVRNVIDATKLSYWLRKSKGRPVGDLKFTGVPGHGGVIAWKVIKAPGASK